MKKNYIKEKDGSVRKCSANIAQMNAWEYCKTYAGIRTSIFSVIAPNFKQLFIELARIIMWILQFIGVGLIFSLIYAHFEIKLAQKDVENNRKFNENRKKREKIEEKHEEDKISNILEDIGDILEKLNE